MTLQDSEVGSDRGRGRGRLDRRRDREDRGLKRRLNGIGWALFLIVIGGLLLMPEGTVPEGAWLIGAGLIMLGVSAVRSLAGVGVSWFGVVLGIVALGIGVSGLFGVDLPWIPILLILLGLSIIIEQVLAVDR
jgi:hypothetical protein